MDSNGRSPLQIDLTGSVVRPPALIVGRTFKGSPSLTPTSSPSSRRVSPSIKTSPPVAVNGCSTPTKRNGYSRFPSASVHSLFPSIFSGRRLVPWIVFIALWTLVGLQVQFSWFYIEDFTLSNEEVNAHIVSERRSIFSSSSRNVDEGHSFVSTAIYGQTAKAANSLQWVGKVFKEGAQGSGEVSADLAAEGDIRVKFNGKHGDEISKDVPSKNDGGSLTTTRQQQWPARRIRTQQPDFKILGHALHTRDDLSESSKDGPDDSDVWKSLPASNYSIGTLVGPFDQLEKRVLGLENEEQKQGCGCQINSTFAKLVDGKSFVIVFHELSMTGAPLSMLELGAKLRSCGGRVSAVVLNKQGGLFSELVARGIRVLQDKAHHSWSAAGKADLVVVGSAACASWVGQYLKFNTRAGDRLIWWIMENRRDYFERAKFLLGKPRSLLFLSHTHATMWRKWSGNEGLSLAVDVDVVPLSVNDHLASIAGLASRSDASAAEKKAKLRNEVRQSMGLEPNDVLVASLSSINPSKGQLLFLQAALMVVDHVENEGLAGLAHVETDSALEYRSRRTSLTGRQIFSLPESFSIFDIFKVRRNPPRSSGKEKRSGSSGRERKSRGGDIRSGSRKSRLPLFKGKKSSLKQRGQNLVRNIVFRFRRKVKQNEGLDGKPRLRILIGSFGSKSNKVPYLEKIAKLLDRNEQLANITLSTPSTTHVAALYAAADIYVMNSQGMGETFGRVTVEAMAFGLPVLATDAGGYKEIIIQNVTGLLHPTGRAGIPALAQNIRRLLENKAARERMGQKGRELVEKRYQEDFVYEKLASKFKEVLDTANSS